MHTAMGMDDTLKAVVSLINRLCRQVPSLHMQAQACAAGKPCTSFQASPVGQWLWQGVVLVDISLVQRDPQLGARQLTVLHAAASALSSAGGRSALDHSLSLSDHCSL